MIAITFAVVLIIVPIVNPYCRKGWCAYKDSWQDTDM